MYTKNTHIHFVGIGGIGMSGVASILKSHGYTISGCDYDTTQATITQLKNQGCSISFRHNGQECLDNTIDILVYIPMYEHTIPAITQEVKNARARNITTVTRAQMLAEIMRTHYSIGVSGSHGKTTTSSLISYLLLANSFDPTIAIGGYLKNINSNARAGKGAWCVVEADESDKSFLDLSPTIPVITNIDVEHLETYKNLDDIKNNFIQFMTNIPFYGKTIVCIDDENIRSILPRLTKPFISYGIEHPADIFAKNIVLNPENSQCTVYSRQSSQPLGEITIPLPGIHNVYNALGALTACTEIGISFEQLQKTLPFFNGVERRFSFQGMYKGAYLYDDYGHHPKEIEHMLCVARRVCQNNLIVVFQPHRYTRTFHLWTEFIQTLSHPYIDTLIITDIYSAGEPAIENITSSHFVNDLRNKHPLTPVHYISANNNFSLIKDQLADLVQPNDLVLFLGAGRVNHIASELAQ